MKLSPLGKAQPAEPSCFLLAVDSAESTAAEFIMVNFKGPTDPDPVARPTCQPRLLAANHDSPATFLKFLANVFSRGRGLP